MIIFKAREWPLPAFQFACIVATLAIIVRTFFLWRQLDGYARVAHVSALLLFLFMAILIGLLLHQQIKYGNKLVAVYPDRIVLFQNSWPSNRVVLHRDQIASISTSGVQYDTDAVDIILEMKTQLPKETEQSRVWSRTSPPSYWYTYAGGKVRGKEVAAYLAKWLTSKRVNNGERHQAHD